MVNLRSVVSWLMRIAVVIGVLTLVGCTGVADSKEAPDSDAAVTTTTSISQSRPSEPGDDWAPSRIDDVGVGKSILTAPELADDFWTPPDPLPGTPGNVIWSSSSRLVFGGDARRVMYHSSDTFGNPVGVTAWLGTPEEFDENTPIVSWGHGTTGMADDCAPTRAESPASEPFFQALLDAGYIVVASDYAYLGTPGHHPYYDAATMAYSMIDAAVAAQQFTGSNGPVIYAGFSIGGRGAIFAQKISQTYAPELDVRGSAAFRPGVDGIAEGGTLWKTLRDSPFKGLVVMAFYGVSLAWGDKYYELSDILTPEAISRLPILESTCLGSVLDAFQSLSGDEVFKIGLDDPLPKGVVGPAEQITDLPLLISGGRLDTIAAPAVIDSYFQEACANGQSIELRWFNLEHGLSTQADEPLFLEWLSDVLDGSPRPNSCETGALRPPLCKDSETCFQIQTAENLEGAVENPFARIPGLNWELLGEWNHAYICPDISIPCRQNRIEGHVSQIWKSEIPVSGPEIESWLDGNYWDHVEPTWQLRLYEKEPRPGWPCGFYFQFLRYNAWGFSTIMPGDTSSTMFVFVTHQNRTTQQPMQEIPWQRLWPCP